MSLQGIKLVTFDATNTLLRFKVPPWELYTTVAREYGFRGSPGQVKSRLIGSFKILDAKYPNFGKNNIRWENWWKEVVKYTFEGQLPASANIDNIANTLIDEFKTSKCWCVADGGSNLIRTLRDRGVSIGIISNSDPRLYDILKNISLYNKFDFIVTSYDVGFSKPDERIFRSAINSCKIPVKPSESLHIGDDLEKDYEGARKAGWHALLVTNNINNEKPPAQGHVFTTLEELSIVIIQKKLQL